MSPWKCKNRNIKTNNRVSFIINYDTIKLWNIMPGSSKHLYGGWGFIMKQVEEIVEISVCFIYNKNEPSQEAI